MIRWRTCLVLTLLLLIPLISGKEDKDDDDEERAEEGNDDDDEEEEEDDEDDQEEDKKSFGGRRVPPVLVSPKDMLSVTGQRRMHKTLEAHKKMPLECYVCAYKAETPLRACLDPSKFRVHTITCHSPEDRCFTSVISHGNTYDAVIRGCRSGCVGTPETTCCEASRCNNQAFAMPVAASHIMNDSKDDKRKALRDTAPRQPTVLFFVTILLLLQTVVRVAIF